jgi:hypothetical protein
MFEREDAVAGRCSFCGSTAGPFGKVESLFTVDMCADCQAVRGHGASLYPVMTRAQMRAGLDLLPRQLVPDRQSWRCRLDCHTPRLG